MSFGAVVLSGRCLPYGESNVWGPIARALRQLRGPAQGRAGQRGAGEGPAGGRRRAGPRRPNRPRCRPSPRASSTCSASRPALDAIDPANARSELTRSVLAFVVGLAHQGPLILSLSDLHWADPLVLELLDRLVVELGSQAFTLLTSARPWEGHLPGVRAGPPQRRAPAPRPARRAGGRRAGADAARRRGRRRRSRTSCSTAAAATRCSSRSWPRWCRRRARSAGCPTRCGGWWPPASTSCRSTSGTCSRTRPSSGRRARGRACRSSPAPSARPAAGRCSTRSSPRELLDVDGDEWVFRSESVREVAYNTLTKVARAQRHAGVADAIVRSGDEDAIDAHRPPLRARPLASSTSWAGCRACPPTSTTGRCGG